MLRCLGKRVMAWIRKLFLPSSLLYWWSNKKEPVKEETNTTNFNSFFLLFSFLDLLISHYFFFKWSLPLPTQVEHRVWRGLVLWLLIGHRFIVGKREETIGGGIHSGDAAGASIVGFVVGGGCCDVEELMLAGGGMWSTVMVGQFVVASNG